MNLLFFTAGGQSIGLGHIMRCLLLAKKLNFKSEFALFKKDKATQSILENEGFKVYLCENFKELSKIKADILIVDNCLIETSFFSWAKRFFKKVVCIDDENELEFYDVDLLINPNIYAKSLDYKATKRTKFLYTLFLRDEFLNSQKIQINPQIQNIFITLGGSDNKNITAKLLEKLCSFENFSFHIALGKAFKYKKELKNLENERLHFYENAKMAALMSGSDLGICACGQSVYEFWQLGIPIISLVLAPNQQRLADFGEKKGLLIYAKNLDQVKEKLSTLSFNQRLELRKNIDENFKPCVNFKLLEKELLK